MWSRRITAIRCVRRVFEAVSFGGRRGVALISLCVGIAGCGADSLAASGQPAPPAASTPAPTAGLGSAGVGTTAGRGGTDGDVAAGRSGAGAAAAAGSSGSEAGRSAAAGAAGRSDGSTLAGAGGGVTSVAGAGAAGAGAAGAAAGSPMLSAGCGTSGAKTGVFDQQIPSGGTMRTITLSIPQDYDGSSPHRLVVGLHGRDYDGARMRRYLNLEGYSDGSVIFVYPWAGMIGGYVGWQLGQYGDRFAGDDDLTFFDDMLAHLKSEYCLDESRVFLTGQSWGGDMTQLLSCVRGAAVRASVGVAANGVYYLPPTAGDCAGKPDTFTLHGVDDDSIPFEQGEALRDFWKRERGCSDQSLSIEPDQCEEFQGCSARTVFCPYGPDNGGHQVPDYYAKTAMGWFLAY